MQSLFKSDRTDTLLESSAPILGPSGAYYATYYYLNLDIPLLAGDTLLITADGEVEVKATYNTEVISQIILDAQWNSNATQLDPGNYEVGHIIGTDLALSPIHYTLPTRSVIYPVPADIAAPTIQYRIRCRSTAATGNDVAVLKPGQGHLAYMLFR